VAGHATTDEEFVIMNHGRMSGSSTRGQALHLWLGPVGILEIEDYDIGQVCAVLILTTKDEELVVLPETCGMT